MVPTAVDIGVRVVTPRELVGRFQCFVRTYCFHLQGGNLFVRPKLSRLYNQKGNTDIFTAVTTAGHVILLDAVIKRDLEISLFV
jgi:hypothetical protein